MEEFSTLKLGQIVRCTHHATGSFQYVQICGMVGNLEAVKKNGESYIGYYALYGGGGQ
jgi:hypothetical protein